MYVERISREAAYPYIRNFHWQHRLPPEPTVQFGLFLGDKVSSLISPCHGIVVFSEGPEKGSLRLQVLWLEDFMDKDYSLSLFLAECCAALRNTDVREVVAGGSREKDYWSTIYAAAGFRETSPGSWKYTLKGPEIESSVIRGYANDAAKRKQLMGITGADHPAKGHLGLWVDIIEHYSEIGDTIVDPMAGVGASLIGATMGRNVICVEKEEHFFVRLRAASERLLSRPLLGSVMGHMTIRHGNSYYLSELLAGSPVPEDNEPNVGKMKNSAYWEAMDRIYGECEKVIKPDGVMAIIIKGYERYRQYVDLPLQTVDRLSGRWILIDRWTRKLPKVSFWRALHDSEIVEITRIDLFSEEVKSTVVVRKNQIDPRLYEEYVLIFRPCSTEETKGIADLVLFSPPYEGILGAANSMHKTKGNPKPKDESFRYTRKKGSS